MLKPPPARFPTDHLRLDRIERMIRPFEREHPEPSFLLSSLFPAPLPAFRLHSRAGHAERMIKQPSLRRRHPFILHAREEQYIRLDSVHVCDGRVFLEVGEYLRGQARGWMGEGVGVPEFGVAPDVREEEEGEKSQESGACRLSNYGFER